MKALRYLTAAAALVLAASGAALLFTPVAISQGAPQAVAAQTPQTRDLGSLRTLTAQGAATVTSSDQSGYNISRLTCVFRQSTFTGSPSTTFKIQNKDAASGQYYDLVTSAAVTSSTAATPLSAGGGVATSANLAIGVPIAATWRISATIAGSATPTVTGTIGCSVQ